MKEDLTASGINSNQTTRILLVDDNTTNLQLLHETLDGLGYRLLIDIGALQDLTDIARDAQDPAEVEAAIDACPGVRSSCVIGLPHADLGNAVHAIVDAADDVNDKILLDHLEQRLARYKIPRSIEFVSDPLRDDAGKMRRRALREARLGANHGQT